MNDGCDHTSTNAPDPIRTPKNDVVRTGDGGVGRMGVTGGVMRRCAWRLARSVGGRLGRWEEFNRI
ncbi:hypothetical protein KY289_000959 [Solanum tuberosum]|nr:hypothetical protein KY289_000959 [Solanum tuberosum]